MSIYFGDKPIKQMWYGNKQVRPKPPKVKTLPIVYSVASALSDFPIYIKPSAITGFGSLTLAEAQSLRFYADSAKTVELPREIVSADEIYVKTDLATGTGNKIYVDWDGVSPDYADNDDYGKYNVWNSNYKAVYHFEGNANDSTSNGNNGTGYNMTYSGGAGVFNGSNSRIAVDSVDIQSATQFSFYSWNDFGSTARSAQNLIRFEGKFALGIWDYRITGHYRNSSYIWTRLPDYSSYSVNTKYNLIWTFGSGYGRVYMDGTQIIEKSGMTTYTGAKAAQDFGCQRSANAEYFIGKIYEARILSTALSSSRISTEYANQSNPATFFGTLT